MRGRGDDAEISDVTGNVTIDGTFGGDTDIRNGAKKTRCATQFSARTFGQLISRLKLDSDDLSLSGVSGDPKQVTPK